MRALKTIVENLGLPPEISGPIAEQGYPVQVNSGFPSGPEKEANEPIPGTVMRTGATEKATYAQTGYSSTCDTSGGDDGDGGGGGGLPGLPGLPEIPGLPGLPIPLLDDLASLLGGGERQDVTSRSTFRSGRRRAADCQIPAQLGALVSFGGFQASSLTERTAGEITSTSRSEVGDIKLAGGVVTLSGVTAKVTSSSDGTTPKGKGKASYGTVTIAGQEFGIGPDGIEAAGSTTPIPGLPDAPDSGAQAARHHHHRARSRRSNATARRSRASSRRWSSRSTPRSSPTCSGPCRCRTSSTSSPRRPPT